MHGLTKMRLKVQYKEFIFNTSTRQILQSIIHFPLVANNEILTMVVKGLIKVWHVRHGCKMTITFYILWWHFISSVWHNGNQFLTILYVTLISLKFHKMESLSSEHTHVTVANWGTYFLFFVHKKYAYVHYILVFVIITKT